MNIKKTLRIEIENLLKEKEVGSKQVEDLIMSIKLQDGHIHNVLPDDPKVRDELIEDLMSYTNLSIPTTGHEKDPPEKVIFKNRQAFGDILTMTCMVRDFKTQFPNTQVGVSTTAMHIWDHNPHIDHQFRDNQYIFECGPGFLTNKSNLWNLHMANAFRVDIQNKMSIRFPQGPVRPDIWMTEEEYNAKPLIEGPYWVFIYGGEPGWPSKQYHRWQEVIDILKDDIQIVQLGVKGHPYPHLDNVIDYIGKTEDRHSGIRELFNIFLHAQGSIGLVSMHMHLSAAFGNPCVVVAGAREPAWFTNYFGHQYVQTNGTMFCAERTACWACKLEGCKNKVEYKGEKIPKCTSIIEPEEVSEAVRKYYKGGRLKYGKKIPNKFFNNIVKEAKIFVAPKPEKIDEALLKEHGFQWGSGSVTDRDWMYMKDIIKENNVKTVLEFGAGLSTLLMGSMVKHIDTFETMPGWIKKIQPKANPNFHSFFTWDGKTAKIPSKHYDMAFVDGPAGGENREWSIKYASKLADVVIVHDAGRVPERKWQAKYLDPEFQLISKGGHRCHYWKRKTLIEPQVMIEDLKDGKPTIKICSTMRGYGGSERSTIFLMRGFLEKGYNVEIVPTGEISGEYRKNIPDGVLVAKSFDRVTGPCDLMVFYCSDTIWNFNKPMYTNVMPHIQAKRKVMVVNFKIGGAGQVEWTKGWDKYLFLNSTHEGELIRRMPGIQTVVMAPPAELDLFFKNTPNYNFPLKLIRHSSQGDNKHHPDTNSMIRDILRIDSSIEFHFMPPKSDCITHPQVYKYPKNQPPVWDFLRKGNCFFYRLPDNYSEGGPRVLSECAAAGLPAIVDNHSGMKDRVTEETGWVCNNWNDYLEVIKYILNNPNCIMEKGIAAREHARKTFVAERWIEEIIGDE
jgi:ADP-heptose:LPS heptosyltransferase